MWTAKAPENCRAPAYVRSVSDRPDTLDLVCLDGGGEALAFRGILEQIGLRHGLRVNLHLVGRASQLVRLLSEPGAPHLLLIGHGDEGGIVIPDLPPELAAAEPFNALLRPEDVRACAKLDGRVVVCTGCSTGNEDLAQAFLAAGASAYIAPEADEDGEAAMGFSVALYFGLLYLDLPLAEAVEQARALGGETELFRLFR
jgi:hypothetical protein